MRLGDGAVVHLDVLGPARVRRLLGCGGEGCVYEVERQGPALALKWYHPGAATDERRRALEALVDRGSPHPRFLWPLSLARVADQPETFGYCMELRAPGFLEMGHLISGRGPDGQPLEVTFASVITLCTQLTDSFLRLHGEGLCYRDISFGNVLFSPLTGDVQICDNDNVGVDNGAGSVLGTPLFMAPEIVSDLTLKTRPSTGTDLHSLAVLLFYAMCMGHPLEGAQSEVGLRSEAWLVRHLGTAPLFVFDPDDDSNRPVSDIVRAYWELYPPLIRDLFTRAFTEGLRDRHARVTEGEWLRALRRLRDAMFKCDSCGQTNFLAGPDSVCRSCSRVLAPTLVMEIGRVELPVSAFTEVRSDHLGSQSWVDLGGRPIGVVRRDVHDESRWGLRNTSVQSWSATLPDGRVFAVEPDQTIDLMDGLLIDLGSTRITVRRPGAGPTTRLSR